MAEMIRDGSGSGRLAKVDSDNRLWVRSVSAGEPTHSSLYAGQYYSVSNNSASDTGQTGWRLHLRNNSESQFLMVQAVVVSATDAGYWKLGVDGVITEGIGTTANAVNFNRSSSSSPASTATHASALTFTTDPTYLTGSFVPADFGQHHEHLHGSLILDRSGTISIYWAADNPSIPVEISVEYYFLDRV